jgi:hypothetical protein
MSASTLYLVSTSTTTDVFDAKEYNSLSTAPVCRTKIEPPLLPGVPPPPSSAMQAMSSVMEKRGVEDVIHALQVTVESKGVAPYLQRNMTNIPRYNLEACRSRYQPFAGLSLPGTNGI